jgi:type II secretory pathway component PulC
MRPLLILALVCSTAAADPAFKTATIDQKEVTALFTAMGETTEEPAGLVVANKSAVTSKLGLQVGDVIRRINGDIATAYERYRSEEPVLYLDVSRGNKAFAVRIDVKLETNLTYTFEHERLLEELVNLSGRTAGYAFTPLTRDGKPSGVQIRVMWISGLADGDIVRTVDGAAVTTGNELVDALTKGADHDHIVIALDRMDQRLNLTLNVEKDRSESPDLAALIATIKRTSDTTYDVPKAVREAMADNPMAVAKTVRVVPALKDGNPDGFKLYAIRPSSIFAALGLTNGDTINAIDDISLASADKALEAYEKVMSEAKITVSITRRGKPLKLTYTIK